MKEKKEKTSQEKKKKPTKMFLVVLQGGGDTEVKLVTKPVWKWIFTTDNFNSESHFNETPPDAVVQEMLQENPTNATPTVLVTCGSATNDRALSAPAPQRTFWSVKEAMEYVKKNDIEIVEEYEGCIY